MALDYELAIKDSIQSVKLYRQFKNQLRLKNYQNQDKGEKK